MPELTPGQIADILESGDFTRFVGAIEGDQFDAKSEPYRLDDKRGKLELAKDVVGFANAKGGIILFSLRTERSSVHLGEEVAEPRPFPRTLVNPERYHRVIGEWVHPRIEGLDIRWYPSAADPNRGLVAITLPPQPDRLKPFLLAHTIDDTGRQRDIVFGYAERRQADTEPLGINDLHGLLRDGRHFSELDQRMDALTATLHTILRLVDAGGARPAPTEPAISAEELSTRRGKALDALGLEEVDPWFGYAAIPTTAVEIPSLFAGDQDPLVQMLNNPPRLRPGGFDLATGGPSQIVPGGSLRRSMLPGHKTVDVWRDGFVLLAAEASEFLSWGTRPRGGGIRINPLVLSETCYSFCALTRHILQRAEPRPQAIDYTIILRNLNVAGRPAELIPFALGTFDWEFAANIYRAAHADLERTIRSDWPEDRVGLIAYRLVREVYRWFGMNDDQIPYTVILESGDHAIDPTAIVRAGTR
jgi:hypothetical protein